MAINIYKPGQGYWTRMLSAIGGGILVVAGALWLKQKLEIFQWEYGVFVQWGAALAVIAIFAPLIYRWVGSKPRTCDFMIATDGEMKKVAWPSRKEVIGSTLVVIWCVVLLSALLFLADVFFSTFFKWINVLDVS
ncbi:preprotein translocase subunit SecE [Planctomycetales bacterium ZRK34]|nr:preprotein translocase subunit SecE [Planctomycetales bacterium ZRK34]